MGIPGSGQPLREIDCSARSPEVVYQSVVRALRKVGKARAQHASERPRSSSAKRFQNQQSPIPVRDAGRGTAHQPAVQPFQSAAPEQSCDFLLAGITLMAYHLWDGFDHYNAAN